MDRFARTIKTLLIVLVLLVGVGAVFSAYAHTAHAQGVSAMVNPQNTLANPVGDEGEGIASMILGWVLRPFAWAFQLVGTLFMTFGSSFLGRAIEISIGDTSPIRTVVGIQVGWQVMRDFSNLFFIFVILYIAIQTILQMGNHDTKKMLVRVIAVALLINFSGLFTRIIIDAGNVLAVGLYNRIVTSNAPNNAASTCGAGNCTIGDRFASILDVNSFAQGGGNVSGALQISIMYFLNGAIFLVLGLVFLKGAFYFIARVLAFIFLIIFSPFAFLAYAVPNSKASSFLSAWWSKLIGYSMLAPAYMMIMYLVLQVSTGIASGGGGFDFMNYVIIVGLIKIGSDQAFKLADSAGTGLANYGAKLGGKVAGVGVGAVTGAAAYTARQTLGRGGNAMANSETLNNRIARGGMMGKFAEFRKNQYTKAAKGSFDVSKTGLGGMALGSSGISIPTGMQQEGGFKKSGGLEHHVFNRGKLTKEQEADKVKHAKELFADDPEKQKQWLQKELGKTWGGKSNYDETTHKDTKAAKSEINQKINQKTAEKDIEAETKNITLHEQNLVAKQQQLQQAITAGNVALQTTLTNDITQIQGFIKTAGDRMKASLKTPGLKVAEMKESVLMSKAFAMIATPQQVKEIHTKFNKGEYTDQNILQTFQANAFAANNTKVTEFLASPEGKRDYSKFNVSRAQVAGTKIHAKTFRKYLKLKRQRNDLNDLLVIEKANPVRDRDAILKLEERIQKNEDTLEKVGDELQSMQQ